MSYNQDHHSMSRTLEVKNKAQRARIKRMAIAAGLIVGGAVYGGLLLISGGSASLLGFLASLGLGAAAGAFGGTILTSNHETPDEPALEEKQVIVISTYAETVQEEGRALQKADTLVRLSQFFWVGSQEEWKQKIQTMDLTTPLNTCPENGLTPVLMIYTLQNPCRKIPFRSGEIDSFLRNYLQNHPEEKNMEASLYQRPNFKDITEFGFKTPYSSL